MLIRTKIKWPRLSREVISRTTLIERLNDGLDRGLALIVAPAGFGKTTLLTEWVSQAPCRVAWLSLDESDNDVVTLLDYFIAAIRQLFPDACPDTLAMIRSAFVPKPEALVPVLINEIDDLPERFALVVDDYHALTDPAIHQLFDLLLRHPPLQLHLMLATRSDPPLALPRLRANRELNELRPADLRFTRQEAKAFLTQTMGLEPGVSLPDDLLNQFEGWVAGLQLAALSFNPSDSTPARTEDLIMPVRNRHVMAYFFEQVWQRQMPHVQMILMKTSILDRMSPALAQAILTEDNVASPPVDLAALESAGLFLNALDETGEWFRCHTLFREMLFDMLRKMCSSDEIAALHHRASRWFYQNHLINEALRHAAASGAAELAHQIVADHFVDRLNHDDWRALQGWLKLLPAPWIENHPWLLLSEAFLAHFQFRWTAIPPLLNEAERHLQTEHSGVHTQDHGVLLAYIQALWSQYWIERNDPLRAKEAAQAALDNLPDAYTYPRGLAVIYLIQALHSLGELEMAERILNEALATEAPSKTGHFTVRLLTAAVALYLSEGNLGALTQASEWLRQKATESDLPVGLAWAHMALGVAAYEANDLDRASEHFTANAALYYTGHARAGHEYLVGLALIERARGRNDMAQRALANLRTHQRDLIDPLFAAEADSLQARIALSEGDLETARHSMGRARLDLSLLWYIWLEVPAITHIRVDIAEGSPSHLEQAQHELVALLELAGRLHKPRRMVELLSLNALLLDRMNERGEALKALRAALELGRPRGLVRAVADVGPQLLPLLRTVAHEAPSEYIDRIMIALQPASDSPISGERLELTPVPPLGLLTHREQDVLDLLGQRYSDREIASALVISPLTVRSYIENLSEKLGVRGRRKLVARARELGLLLQ
ncbi:MAG: LuxR C-terminal-related transcriptional regulator [Anaerolineae bacterium]